MKRVKQFIWSCLPHTHGVDDMTFMGVYNPGQYEIWICNRCGFEEAL